jgi:hypothetical protein
MEAADCSLADVIGSGHLRVLGVRGKDTSCGRKTLIRAGSIRAVTWLSGFEVGPTLRHATMGRKVQKRTVPSVVLAWTLDGDKIVKFKNWRPPFYP